MIKYLVETLAKGSIWADLYEENEKQTALDYCKEVKSHIPSYQVCKVYEVDMDEDTKDADFVLELIENGYIDAISIAVNKAGGSYREAREC